MHAVKYHISEIDYVSISAVQTDRLPIRNRTRDNGL